MTALSRVELSTVAAVFQATPLVITMGAALFMGESVGWRRWSAIATGFLGVLLIIRPGFEGFNPDALYVLFSVLCVAFRDLITRRISPQVGTMTVSLQAFFAVLLSGLILFIATGTTPVLPTATLNAYTFGAALFGGVGVYGIVQAMRVAEASAVQPFRYSRLVFSMLLGMILFAERPDLLTYLGSALIIASGLYTFFRERRFTP